MKLESPTGKMQNFKGAAFKKLADVTKLIDVAVAAVQKRLWALLIVQSFLLTSIGTGGARYLSAAG